MNPIGTTVERSEFRNVTHPMRVAVLTISDSVSKGEREDLSGPAVVAACRGLGWEVTSALRSSDDPANIREQLRELADSKRVDLILTTGGTGIGPRDNTPEATQAVADRTIPGIAEEMRRKGMQLTPTAVLSRGGAAARGHTPVVKFPRCPKGAAGFIDVLGPLPH